MLAIEVELESSTPEMRVYACWHPTRGASGNNNRAALGQPFDRPRSVWNRYHGIRPLARRAFWWPHAQIGSIREGAELVVASRDEAAIRVGIDGWRLVDEVPAKDTGLGFFAARLDKAGLKAGQQLEFTIRRNTGEWIGRNFSVAIQQPAPGEPVS